jgi:hypothetical protein
MRMLFGFEHVQPVGLCVWCVCVCVRVCVPVCSPAWCGCNGRGQSHYMFVAHFPHQEVKQQAKKLSQSFDSLMLAWISINAPVLFLLLLALSVIAAPGEWLITHQVHLARSLCSCLGRPGCMLSAHACDMCSQGLPLPPHMRA